MKKLLSGASIDITLKLADYESLKPGFWCGIEEEVPDDWNDAQCLGRITDLQAACRKVCEDHIDIDIEDIKHTKLFQEVLKLKKGRK
jgi:hypothetical protein